MIRFIDGEGRWFSQTAYDAVLEPLAQEIVAELTVEGDVVISYDPVQDFSHCVFRAGGKAFDIRFYKVLSCTVDGVDGWTGCPVYARDAFVQYLKKQAGAG